MTLISCIKENKKNGSRFCAALPKILDHLMDCQLWLPRHIRDIQHRVIQQSPNCMIHIHIFSFSKGFVVMIRTSFKFTSILYYIKAYLSNIL